MSGDYSDMQWNDEQGCYECLVAIEEKSFRIVYKFSEGKLCAIRIIETLSDEIVSEYMCYDFGKVSEITIPEISE